MRISDWSSDVCSSDLSTREEFAASVLIEGDALLADLACANPRSPTTLTGFAAAMDKTGAWERIPLIMAAVGASGPVDQVFFDWVVERLRARLLAAGPLEARKSVGEGKGGSGRG